ncbi:MAG TPA: DUF4396 domain-containing protein [Dehalococcoidia bacterium]|nr:DUF4396 domain-containing protein [Dehalococcoidia bacterium]
MFSWINPGIMRTTFSATVHCLTGCAIGEVLGVGIGAVLGLSDFQTIALAVVLAFFFGYALTIGPLLRGGVALSAAIGVAFAADTVSIVVMELLDNAIIMVIPGAMEAGLFDALFWASLAFALAVAFTAVLPVNYMLVSRGLGPAAHASHGGHAETGGADHETVSAAIHSMHGTEDTHVSRQCEACA